MAETRTGVNSPLTVKRYAGALFTASIPQSFIGKTMMVDVNSENKGSSAAANAPICVINDLTSEAGQKVSFNIFAQLRKRPTVDDDNLEGNLEKLDAYTDEISIVYVRHGVDAGGLMTRKRNLDDLRMQARTGLADYFKSLFDQHGITTLMGARGISDDLIIPLGASAPLEGMAEYRDFDTNHQLYPHSIQNKASITASDTMSKAVLDRLVTKADTQGGGANGILRFNWLERGAGGKGAILLMHPLQEQDLRNEVGTGGWLDIQKAAAAATGESSPIFKNSLGEYRGLTLRTHQFVPQFNDYGVGANVKAARAVMMGRQSMAVAFGDSNSKGMRCHWTEKALDVDDARLSVSARMCYGFVRPHFNGQDVNAMAVDTAITPL